MNILIQLSVVVIAVTAVVEADDGPPSNYEQEYFWTPCEPDYIDPRGVCRSYGFSVTTNPVDGGYTKAKEVDHWWTGGTFRCGDAPVDEVRFFCAKKFTKAYWAGTAPLCGSKAEQEQDCRNNGYTPTRFTSDSGDGEACSWSGTKVLCAKE